MTDIPWISPEIFTIHLFGMEFSLRWYALAYLVGLLAGWRIMVALMRGRRFGATARRCGRARSRSC